MVSQLQGTQENVPMTLVGIVLRRLDDRIRKTSKRNVSTFELEKTL